MDPSIRDGKDQCFLRTEKNFEKMLLLKIESQSLYKTQCELRGPKLPFFSLRVVLYF